MEYIQMTLTDWVEMKQKLKQELLGVRQSFVRIGYMLRKVEEQKGYEQDGYKSIAEFAQKELGLHPSTTTRFMEINREYSIDGYSERLREEYLDLSRSQLEEMLKLPDADRQMVQSATPRECIRELKRFNDAKPAAGPDNIAKLIENFFHDNREILNEVFNKKTFIKEPSGVKQFAEIVNPGGNRSYKKGMYFLMMYENRISVKRFGENPIDMTWEEFRDVTEQVFGEHVGKDTWKNYFGEEVKKNESTNHRSDSGNDSGRVAQRKDSTSNTGDDARCSEETVNQTDSEQRRDAEGNEPEADSRADGENSVEDEPEDQKGAVEDHGGVSETGAGETKDDTAGEESSESDCEEPAGGETAEPSGEESQSEEIAPAQKTAEILEAEDLTTPESPMGKAIEAIEHEALDHAMNQPEVLDKPFGTRKDYMDTLTAWGMANYMASEYEKHRLKASSLAFPYELEKWLEQEVDDQGRPLEGEDE